MLKTVLQVVDRTQYMLSIISDVIYVIMITEHPHCSIDWHMSHMQVLGIERWNLYLALSCLYKELQGFSVLVLLLLIKMTRSVFVGCVCPVCCRICVLYPLDASSTPFTMVVTTENVSGHCRMSLKGKLP